MIFVVVLKFIDKSFGVYHSCTKRTKNMTEYIEWIQLNFNAWHRQSICYNMLTEYNFHCLTQTRNMTEWIDWIQLSLPGIDRPSNLSVVSIFLRVITNYHRQLTPCHVNTRSTVLSTPPEHPTPPTPTPSRRREEYIHSINNQRETPQPTLPYLSCIFQYLCLFLNTLHTPLTLLYPHGDLRVHPPWYFNLLHMEPRPK